MDILSILRIAFGLPLVLFIPGFALTLALWPKTKGEVYGEVLDALKGKNIKEVCVVGSTNEVEDLLFRLKDSGIKTKIYDTYTERKVVPRASKDDVVKAGALVLADDLENYEFRLDPKGKFIVDMKDNFNDVLKIEDTIDTIERIALGFGLSIAIVPLLGIILDKTPFGIKLESIFFSLLGVIFMLFLVYYYRRRHIPFRLSKTVASKR